MKRNDPLLPGAASSPTPDTPIPPRTGEIIVATPRRKASLIPRKPQDFSFNLSAGHSAVIDKQRGPR